MNGLLCDHGPRLCGIGFFRALHVLITYYTLPVLHSPMQHANQGHAQLFNACALRIGIVQSRFNSHITDALMQAACAELHALGMPPDAVVHVQVPGALEIPYALQTLTVTGHYDALIALGCVIRGETYHFELVANESAAGITRVALDSRIPIANGVLTTEDEAQALERMHDKGRDAARVAVEMAQLRNLLANSESHA